MSSLTVEDAVAYRAFLRRPSPAARWVGPSKPRTSPEWRPFSGPLSARSVAYAVSVIGALYRWLIEQGYLLANPFSGIKVRGASKARVVDASHVFTPGKAQSERPTYKGCGMILGHQYSDSSAIAAAFLNGLRSKIALQNTDISTLPGSGHLNFALTSIDFSFLLRSCASAPETVWSQWRQDLRGSDSIYQFIRVPCLSVGISTDLSDWSYIDISSCWARIPAQPRHAQKFFCDKVDEQLRT
jgi:hypothetical protein